MKKIIIGDIKTGVETADSDSAAIETAKAELLKAGFGCVSENKLYIYKKSIDARHKNNLQYVYSVAFELGDGDMINVLPSNMTSYEDEEFPDFNIRRTSRAYRPVIIGFGPCGIFAAYILSLYGYDPIVFERGDNAAERTKKVDALFLRSVLDEESNVCFGEGGAGLFSDGKLVTRIKDRKVAYIIKTFVKFGAPREILYNAKPHLGTDNLTLIVENMRREIIKNGGEVRFNSKLTDIDFNNGKHLKLKINNNEEHLTDALFLATGHSAEDIYSLLMRKKISMIPKGYSIGVRIEHKREYIDEIIYGKENLKYNLPPAEYFLSHRENDRGVYTFCMCPGGVVVNSSSSSGRLVTNGMSYYKRDGINSNAAVLVSFSPEDFGGNIKAMLDLRKDVESKTYALGGGDFTAPVQTVGSFFGDGGSRIKSVLPSYTGKTKECDLNNLFPRFIDDLLHAGIKKFDAKIKGYYSSDAILTAAETRTSAPVRILRDSDTYTSPDSEFLYPAGEGAGYAGGITSSAADGINAAIKYIER